MKEYYLPGEKKLFYKKNNFKVGRKTLVFVHGLSGSSSAWIPYEEKFKKDYNIISIDLRGHGKSFRPKSHMDYSINQFSEDIFNILNFEKVKKCIFISHSFGSIITLNFIKKYKNKVMAAIFLSASFLPSKKFISKIISPLYYIGRIIPSKNEGTHLNYNNYKNTGDWNLNRMYADIANTGISSYFNSLANIYKFDGAKILETIDFPVFIIHGKKDSLFSIEHAREMHLLIKNSKFFVIDNANHVFVINNIDELTKLIADFIKKIK